MRVPSHRPLVEVLEVHKALSDRNRLRIVAALNSHELCVCQITELLKLAPSTVSKHLSILRQARLVEMRKVGRWIFYRAALSESDVIVSETLKFLGGALSNDRQIREDVKRLKEILKIDPDVLCRRM